LSVSVLEVDGPGDDAAAAAFETMRRVGRIDHVVLDLAAEARRHPIMWAAAAAAGTGLFFDEEVSPEESGPVLRFLAAGPHADAAPRTFTFGSKDYRLFGAKRRTSAKWWLQSLLPPAPPRDDGEEELEEDAGTPSVEGATIVIDALEPGRYRVEWWQTYEGKRLTAAVVRCPRGRLALVAPPFASDVAGFAVRVGGF
jgi:hypothetical protein